MTRVRTILLVEDDERDIDLTLRAFAKANLANRIDVARNGEEGLAYLRREGQWADRPNEHPALVLLDLKMPRMGGLAMLREMRQDSRFRVIPVVLLTSSHEPRDLSEAYALGANAFVVKPVDFMEFIDAAQQIGAFWALLNKPPSGTPPVQRDGPS
jgi:CheY-like chemotaxis protein